MKRFFCKNSMTAIMVLLTIIVIFGGGVDLVYAGPTEDLDSKGLIEMYSDGSVTLKAGETYYIALRGGDGGSGGLAWRVYHYEERYIPDTVGRGTGVPGTLAFYEVEVIDDTIINLYYGSNGADGGDALPGAITKDERPGPGEGGTEGTTGFSIGSGLPGSDGVDCSCRIDFPSGDFYYNVSGGGGGGAASVITFNNNNDMRIAANGGDGGIGAYTVYTCYKDDGSGWWSNSSDKERRGSGGAGGVVAQNFDNIPGVTIKQLSTAEGIARIIKPASPGAVIRKQRKSTDKAIPVKDIMVGEHIVLTNSVDNVATIFTKTGNELEFKYVSGGTIYNNGVGVDLQWYHFSKYAVSGSGNRTNVIIKVKSDLAFVDGDGSAIFPYYPEPAGSVSTGDSGSSSGGSGGLDTENFEMLINSIISVSSMIENLGTTIVDQNEQNNNVGEFKPFTLEIKTMNGATVTKNNNVNVHAKVIGRATNEIMYKIFINGEETEDYNKFPNNNIINVSGLTNGLNNIMILVTDLDGNTQSDLINIWKL